MHNILCRPKSLTILNEKTIAFNSIAIGMQQLSSCKYLVKSNPQIVSLDPFLLANTRRRGIEWNVSNKSFPTDFKQIGIGNETSLAAAAAPTFDWLLGFSELHSDHIVMTITNTNTNTQWPDCDAQIQIQIQIQIHTAIQWPYCVAVILIVVLYKTNAYWYLHSNRCLCNWSSWVL